MKLSVFKNRVERYDFFNSAGKYYVDETSEIIKKLNSEGKKALLGIQNKKGVYTIIGERFIYYSTTSSKNGEISFEKFSNELENYENRIGNGYLKLKFMYKNIVLSSKDKVWLHNADTMFSLQFIILWIQKLPDFKIDDI